MDWELTRASSTKGYKAQMAQQDSKMRRLVLDARCSVCNARLIKKSFILPKEQYELLLPLVRKFYEEDQKCKEC